MLLRIIKSALLFTAVVFLFLSSWLSFEFYSIPREPQRTLLVDVQKGQSAKNIAENLKKQGIIKKTWPFLVGYKILFSPKSLKAGEYVFALPLSTNEVLDILMEGRIYLRPVTIPEGLTREEIASHLQSLSITSTEDFLKSSADPSLISSLDKKAGDLEGYLFPETYHFPKAIQAPEIVSSMLDQFQEIFNKKWIKRADALGMTVRDVVILASLIEEETSHPEERKLVSAVFHNRLKIGMKLDCDPTIIYILKKEKKYKNRLRSKDLKFDSPFNTYLNPGLPPGPISSPGRDSLEAALYPAEQDFLYFVSKNDGSHHFSRTFREHQLAVIKYQKK